MLQDFVDYVEHGIEVCFRKGSRLTAIYVCPGGEQGIMEENLKTPSRDVDLVPELRIHGVPIKVHKRMRPGRFLYVLKEEK